MNAAHVVDEPCSRESFYSSAGRTIDSREAVLLWQEIAAGQWNRVDGIDLADLRVAWLTPGNRIPIEWAALSDLEREVLYLLATDQSQKFIALELASRRPRCPKPWAQRESRLALIQPTVRTFRAATDLHEASPRR
jgi:hypothetical protein